MIIHLAKGWTKGDTVCGLKGVDVSKRVDKQKLHLVTCYPCLRGQIESLEREMESFWEQSAGESI